MKPHTIRYLLPIFALLSLSCGLFQPPFEREQINGVWVPNAPQLENAPFQKAQVIEVIDGDTIVVLVDGFEERVRYIGIDTPEREDVCYQEATDANAALVFGQTVRLAVDVSERDQYGRLLRYVYVDNILVNAELVAGGWAEAKEYRPDTLLADLLDTLESDAAANDRGCYPTGIFSNR